ncbi:MAG: hypothetical protein U0Q07_16010 [Acidimicrobiales bacterium]
MSPTTTHDGGPTSPLDSRLRDALRTETSGVDASATVWDAIRSAADTVVVPIDAGGRSNVSGTGPGRVGDRRRGQALLLAVAACVAVALIAVGIVVARRDDGRDVYVGPTTTAGTGTTVALDDPLRPTSDLGRALWATAGLRYALEREQLATVAARYDLDPGADQRLANARAATDAAAGEVTDQALPRLGDGETERNARQVLESRMRNLAVIRRAAGDPGSPDASAPNRVGGDTTTILGQYDLTVEAVAVVARIIAKQGGGAANGTQAQREAATRTIQAAQLTEVPGQQAQLFASASAHLAIPVAEDRVGPLDPDTERLLQARHDAASSPEARDGWPGVDPETRSDLAASVNDRTLQTETKIRRNIEGGEPAGGPSLANDLIEETTGRLAQIHRFERRLLSRL